MQQRRYILFWLVIPLLAACSSVRPKNFGALAFWQTNRLDPAGERHGRWRTHYDENNRKLASQGRFRHGLPVGRWRYYTFDGALERQERYQRRPVGLLVITYYHPNGRVARRGQARVVAEPDGPHFYWFGDWIWYSPDGRPARVETYEIGQLRKTRPL